MFDAKKHLENVLRSNLWWTLCHPGAISTNPSHFEDLTIIGAWSGREIARFISGVFEHVDGDSALRDFVDGIPGIEIYDSTFDEMWEAFNSMPWDSAPEILETMFLERDWSIPNPDWGSSDEDCARWHNLREDLCLEN